MRLYETHTMRLVVKQDGFFTDLKKSKFILLRKEVIQPHLPIRLPCYDLVPLTKQSFDIALIKQTSSGSLNSGGLTGGVYKTRERIHPVVADTGLLTIPASCRRIAAYNPNWDWFFGIGSTSRLGNPLYQPL